MRLQPLVLVLLLLVSGCATTPPAAPVLVIEGVTVWSERGLIGDGQGSSYPVSLIAAAAIDADREAERMATRADAFVDDFHRAVGVELAPEAREAEADALAAGLRAVPPLPGGRARPLTLRVARQETLRGRLAGGESIPGFSFDAATGGVTYAADVPLFDAEAGPAELWIPVAEDDAGAAGAFIRDLAGTARDAGAAARGFCLLRAASSAVWKAVSGDADEVAPSVLPRRVLFTSAVAIVLAERHLEGHAGGGDAIGFRAVLAAADAPAPPDLPLPIAAAAEVGRWVDAEGEGVFRRLTDAVRAEEATDAGVLRGVAAAVGPDAAARFDAALPIATPVP